jgi:hypothetical protein
MSAMELKRGIFSLYSGAFGQAEQVVRLLPIILGFQVLVPVAANRDHNPNALPVNVDEEPPLSGFDPGNRVLLGELPLLPIVETTDVFDALVRVVPVGFVDAPNLKCVLHFVFSNFGGFGDTEGFC